MSQVNISDVIPCIYRFLAKNGFSEAAKAIKTKCDIDAKGGISNIKLLKICKFYLKHHPELVKPEEEEEEEEEEETPKVTKGKANGVQNGKRAAKKQIEEEEEEEEKPVTNKKVKTEAASTKSKKASKKMEEEEEEEEEEKPTTKKGKTEASSTKQRKASKQEEDEEEEEVKPKSKKQSETAIKEKSASTSALNTRKSSKNIEEEEEEEEIIPQKHQGRFSYVDASLYEELPDHSKDNRFEAKAIFGNGGDAFGQYGNERLIHTRGKGFTKEKNKLKNKQFHGGAGRIDAFASNSIKFVDED